MSTPGPTLLKPHLQAHSKDYAVTRLLTLLDIASKSECEGFTFALRSHLASTLSSLSLLTPSGLRSIALTFLTSSPNPTY